MKMPPSEEELAKLTPEQRAEVERLLEFWPQEDLLPELEPYVYDDGPLGPTLHHPLVIMIGFSREMMAGQANKQLRYKKEALARAQTEGDWVTYMFLHERPYRAEAVAEVRAFLGDQYWPVMRALWVDTENLRQWAHLIPLLLVVDAPPGDMMNDEERQALAEMPESFAIYRGYNGRVGKGWSWTLDEDRAKWFARRFAAHRGTARVAKGVVRKSGVLAYLTDRNEDEIVVSPEKVRKITRRALEES